MYTRKLFRAEASVHRGMLTRCHNPNATNYSYYGGRGISVCDQWKGEGGFNQFLKDVGERPSANHSLDRINVERNYEPGNVRWSEKLEQATNKRSTVFITKDGETKSLSEWCKITGINVKTASVRIKSGWEPIRAITEPIANKAKSFIDENYNPEKDGRSTEENTWYGIRNRCYCKSEPAYKHYGGRGIKVCDRWLKSFDNFLEDMGPKPTPIHSLERLDVNGNYSPENCKWALPDEQGRNTRKTRHITIKGETKCLLDWSKVSGVPVKTIGDRIRLYGWNEEEAIFTPPIRIN